MLEAGLRLSGSTRQYPTTTKQERPVMRGALAFDAYHGRCALFSTARLSSHCLISASVVRYGLLERPVWYARRWPRLQALRTVLLGRRYPAVAIAPQLCELPSQARSARQLGRPLDGPRLGRWTRDSTRRVRHVLHSGLLASNIPHARHYLLPDALRTNLENSSPRSQSPAIQPRPKKNYSCCPCRSAGSHGHPWR